jgi:hypothetical protein
MSAPRVARAAGVRTTYTFTDVPLYDSPVLIADRSVVGL